MSENEIFVGHNGQVRLSESGVTIIRKGAISFLTQGFAGDKNIPYSSITSVQFSDAGMFLNGYIQFGVKGGIEGRGALTGAVKDENTIMFRVGKQATEFARLRKIVEDKIRISQSTPLSEADELIKFSDLRDKGIISEVEFEAKKKKILGL